MQHFRVECSWLSRTARHVSPLNAHSALRHHQDNHKHHHIISKCSPEGSPPWRDQSKEGRKIKKPLSLLTDFGELPTQPGKAVKRAWWTWGRRDLGRPPPWEAPLPGPPCQANWTYMRNGHCRGVALSSCLTQGLTGAGRCL